MFLVASVYNFFTIRYVCITCYYKVYGCVLSCSVVIFCSPKDCSPPGFSVHGDSPGKNTGVGCHAILQGIFPIQGSNPGFPHCRRILYHLSQEGIPKQRGIVSEWRTHSQSLLYVKSLSCVRLLATPWTAAHQAPLSMGFSRQEYWSGVPLPSPY